MDEGTCPLCGEPLIWMDDAHGQHLALDAAGDPDGIVTVMNGVATVHRTGDEAHQFLIDAGIGDLDRYQPHAITCSTGEFPTGEAA